MVLPSFSGSVMAVATSSDGSRSLPTATQVPRCTAAAISRCYFYGHIADGRLDLLGLAYRVAQKEIDGRFASPPTKRRMPFDDIG